MLHILEDLGFLYFNENIKLMKIKPILNSEKLTIK